jgi:restriction system-associated AAA family ATPase
MKLISAKILGDNNFRSLQKDKVYNFNRSIFDDSTLAELVDMPGISKMIFTGLNGTGKSNFLQFLAEAFSFLDGMEAPEELRPSGGNFGFEIVYSIFLTEDFAKKILKPLEHDQYVEVKAIKFEEKIRDVKVGRRVIKATKDNNYEISIKRSHEGGFERVENNQNLLLPNKIIAYTSGHNEMLSNPFFRTKFRYFFEFQELKQKGLFKDKLIFLDYNTSQYVFIANMLLSPDSKLKHLKEKTDIVDLNRFRISINYNDYQKKKITLSEELSEKIEQLKSCASSWIHISKGQEDYLLLDYFINDSTKSAFIHYFKTAYNLFSTLLQLHLLNIYAVGRDLRKNILQSPKWVIFADEIAKESPHNLPFRLERIEFNKSKTKEPLTTARRYYRSLSDGEHQFLHLIGTVMLFEEGNVLYLFDEPETHFNPQWKYDYFKLLDAVSSEIDSEILMTTHDPVLISGIRKEQLLMFKKSKDGEISITNPEKDVIGMGVDAILTSEIFGLNTTLDSETMNDLINRRKLLVLGEKRALSEIENETLTELSRKLMDIDFNKPFADPLYKDFIMAIENLDIYNKVKLSESDIKEREEIARQIMVKLNKNGL